MKCPKHPLYKALKPPRKRPGRVARECICAALYRARVRERASAKGAYTTPFGG